MGSWLSGGGAGPVARGLGAASCFLKWKREGRSLREGHDGFLEAAMTGPGGGLGRELVWSGEDGERSRQELHGRGKERRGSWEGWVFACYPLVFSFGVFCFCDFS